MTVEPIDLALVFSMGVVCHAFAHLLYDRWRRGRDRMPPDLHRAFHGEDPEDW